MIPFTPMGAGAEISASTSDASGNVTVPAAIPTVLRIVNGASAIAYVAIGATADNTGFAVPPNSVGHLALRPGTGGTTAVHVILSTGTGKVSAQPGRCAL